MRIIWLLSLFVMRVQMEPGFDLEKLINLFEYGVEVPQRSAITNETLRWPNATVPYLLDEALSEDEIDSFRFVMGYIQCKTCVRWIPRRETDKDYVYIKKGQDRSWSNVGRIGGEQLLTVRAPPYYRSGIILHQLLHTLGFIHQHQAYDRDDYVIVNMDNVNEKEIHNFEKVEEDEMIDWNLPYDIWSVMHYPAYASAINSSIPTITLNPNVRNVSLEHIGFGVQHGILSPSDVDKIKFLYCNKTN